MNILITSVGFGTHEAEACITEWRAHHIVEQMPLDRITAYVRFDPASSLALVDVIVCMADSDSVILADDDNLRFRGVDFPVEKALRFAEDFRNLPDIHTMRDGRKWKKIPIAIFATANPHRHFQHAHVLSLDYPAAALAKVQALVDEYHDRVLNDYENLGMLMRFEKGRAQISSALKLKKEEGDFYYAPGDRRHHQGWVTVKRDREGLRADIELFEILLERGANEREMHRFFEEHPAILMEAWLGIPSSHRPRFDHPKDNTADYSFSPILGPWKDKAIELLEMKGPAEGTLRKGPHPGFTAQVSKAVDQVRDYDRYLRDPANITAVLKGVGYLPDASKLAVLIGRAPKSDAEREVWTQRQSELDVNVVTYDEILAKQVAHLQDSHPYEVLSDASFRTASRKTKKKLS